MATLVQTAYLSFIPLVSRMTGALMLPLNNLIDFNRDSVYQVDLTALVQSQELAHPIQSMFADASNVAYGNTVVQVFGSGQRIVFPAQTQGYYPLLIPSNAFVFTVTNGSNVNLGVSTPLNLFFMTVPFVASQWSTSTATSGGYGVGGLGQNPLGS